MYSDAGLLGAMVICEAASAGKVVAAVAAALRSAKVYMHMHNLHMYMHLLMPAVPGDRRGGGCCQEEHAGGRVHDAGVTPQPD